MWLRLRFNRLSFTSSINFPAKKSIYAAPLLWHAVFPSFPHIVLNSFLCRLSFFVTLLWVSSSNECCVITYHLLVFWMVAQWRISKVPSQPARYREGIGPAAAAQKGIPDINRFGWSAWLGDCSNPHRTTRTLSHFPPRPICNNSGNFEVIYELSRTKGAPPLRRTHCPVLPICPHCSPCITSSAVSPLSYKRTHCRSN